MGKAYKINMDIDVSGYEQNCGFIMKPHKDNSMLPGDKRNGPEVFVYLCDVALISLNPKVNLQQLNSFRKVIREMTKAIEKKEWISNKTDIDLIRNAIDANPMWPHNDAILDVLEDIKHGLDNAQIIEG